MNKISRNIEDRFYYSRNLRVALLSTVIAYLTYSTLKIASKPSQSGFFQINLANMEFFFPAASMIAILLSAFMLLSMSEFVTKYFKIVDIGKYRKYCSISPRLLTTAIASIVFWITYNCLQAILLSQRDGILQIPILNDFSLSIPVALTVSFTIGALVFFSSFFFYRSLEGLTPKKASGDILSEMLFRPMK